MKIERKKSFFGRFMAFLGAFLGLFMGVQGVFFGGSSVFDRFYRGKTEYISDTLRLSETEPLKELENLIKIEITEVAEETYAPNYNYLSGSYSTKTKNGVSGGRGALNIAPLDSFAAQYNVSVVSPEIVKSPGNAIYRTGKLVYAHNAAGLFAGLSGLWVGAEITLTENGVTTAYRVSDIKMFEKDVETGALKLYGNGSYMNFLTKTAFYHDLALMTCAGASYGNGDASHRLVVFIDKI